MSVLTLDQPFSSASVLAQRMRTSMAAARVSFTWFGTQKTLTTQQKAEAAGAFGAEGAFLSAGKKLLDTRCPEIRAVSAVRNRVVSFWRGVSLPFPEAGIRLIGQERIEFFDQQMGAFQAQLETAVEKLDRQFDALRDAASHRLGRLYDRSDYPDSLIGLFAVSWDFPSVEPPDYLRELHPRLYSQECARVAARFDEAVQLAEQAFVEEFSNFVSHLAERLQGDEQGKPKIFRDSAVNHLHAFFERFRSLNVRSSQELDSLVSQCQTIIRGVAPQELRDSQLLRRQVARDLATVDSALGALLVDRPRRRILRTPK